MNIKRVLAILGSSALTVLLIYLAVAAYFHNRFVFNTTIAGVDVGNMKTEQASKLFANLAEDYEMELDFREDQKETIKGGDFDFTYHNEGDVKSAMNKQSALQWLLIVVEGEDYPMEISFNEKKLNKVVRALPEMKKKNMKRPENAKAGYKEGKFVVVPEVMGTKLKKKAAVALVSDQIKKGAWIADMEDAYINPDIYQQDEGMVEEVDRLNKDYAATITYKFPSGKKQVLDGATILKWLVRDEDGVYQRDEDRWNEKTAEYAAKLGEKLDTVNKDHKFKTNTGDVITLPGLGYYGWKVDQEAEAAQITDDINGKTPVKREPVYARREAASPKDNYGYGDTYVEVNLSDQTLWVYKDGDMVFSTPVVSGLPTSKRRTPSGAFYAYDIGTDRELVGQGYSSHVNYWIRLTEMGVGIHDATWRGSFGGSIWTYDGSHGCINVPLSAARTLYDIVETYMPVAVYY